MLQARLGPDVHVPAGCPALGSRSPRSEAKWRRWQSASFAVGSSLLLWTLIISAVDWLI